MIILHLTPHRALGPRSLGDIEKAACAAAFILDSDTIIRAVRPSTVSLGARSASCWSRPSLPNTALLIQHRRRFFVEEHVRGPAAKDIGLVYCCLRALSLARDGIRVMLPRSIPSEIAPTKKRRVRHHSYLFTIGQRDTTSVDIQCPRTPSKHVLRHRRFRQR